MDVVEEANERGQTPPDTTAWKEDTGFAGSFPKWSRVELTLMGPRMEGMAEESNPFKVQVDVLFTGPDGQTYKVPAFYDGDGAGGLNGPIWKVRFSPDALGTWNYVSTSVEPELNDVSGTFEVTAPTGCQVYVPGDQPDLSCVGRLQYVGERYLKYADGPYWLKGGSDEPEDFLAPEQTLGFSTKREGIDFLADVGVNSLYIMLHNTGPRADRRNVWPWVGDSEEEAQQNHEHFDVAKLAEWEEIFTYLQDKGITLHLVLEDDSGWTEFNRAMYYREMVARFGHHNSLIWNLGEEYNENYSPGDAKAFAQMITALDPYDHPLTIHHQGTLENWSPFIGDERFDLASLQDGQLTRSASYLNEEAVNWIERTAQAGRPIPISWDEAIRVTNEESDLSRQLVWAVYLGGGNLEVMPATQHRYDYYATHFSDMALARSLIEQLSFWQMESRNDLLQGADGFVLAYPGNDYVVYLPNGGRADVDLREATGAFKVVWFNPRTGDISEGSAISGGAIQQVQAPFDGDAALHLQCLN